VFLEKKSGPKINYHKSEFFGLGKAGNMMSSYIQLFGCKEGSFPFKYLGIPMSQYKIAKKDWGQLETRFRKEIE